jgi:hypothetical protein
MSLKKSRNTDSFPGAVAKVIATLGNGDIPAGLAGCAIKYRD